MEYVRMNKPVWILVAAILSTSAFADEKSDNLEQSINAPAGGPSVMGNLDGSATFDRRFLVTYDGTCAAASSDSGNDGSSYDTYLVHSPSGQPMQAEVVLDTLADSVLFVYCTPFSPASPETNIRAWNDDGGVGFGSAIVAADGVAMVPNEVYTLVVSGFGPADLGTYTLNLGGDLQFGEPAAPALAVSTGAINFGSVPAGSTSTASLTLSNNGDGAGAVTSLTFTGPFSRSGGTCPAAPFDLDPQTSCTIGIQFSAAAVGAAAGSLTIAADGGPFVVDLAGNGQIPPPAFIPVNSGWGLGLLAALMGVLAIVLLRRRAG